MRKGGEDDEGRRTARRRAKGVGGRRGRGRGAGTSGDEGRERSEKGGGTMRRGGRSGTHLVES